MIKKLLTTIFAQLDISIFNINRDEFTLSGTVNWENDNILAYSFDSELKWLNLHYTTYYYEGEKTFNYCILLNTTKCYFGNKRYWFLCVRCHQRAKILYMDYKTQYFVCRKCLNLVYPSQNKNLKGTFGNIRKLLDHYKKIEQLEESISRESYNGKTTKKYQRLELLNIRTPPLCKNRKNNA